MIQIIESVIRYKIGSVVKLRPDTLKNSSNGKRCDIHPFIILFSDGNYYHGCMLTSTIRRSNFMNNKFISYDELPEYLPDRHAGIVKTDNIAHFTDEDIIGYYGEISPSAFDRMINSFYYNDAYGKEHPEYIKRYNESKVSQSIKIKRIIEKYNKSNKILSLNEYTNCL